MVSMNSAVNVVLHYTSCLCPVHISETNHTVQHVFFLSFHVGLYFQ